MFCDKIIIRVKHNGYSKLVWVINACRRNIGIRNKLYKEILVGENNLKIIVDCHFSSTLVFKCSELVLLIILKLIGCSSVSFDLCSFPYSCPSWFRFCPTFYHKDWDRNSLVVHGEGPSGRSKKRWYDWIKVDRD